MKLNKNLSIIIILFSINLSYAQDDSYIDGTEDIYNNSTEKNKISNTNKNPCEDEDLVYHLNHESGTPPEKFLTLNVINGGHKNFAKKLTIKLCSSAKDVAPEWATDDRAIQATIDNRSYSIISIDLDPTASEKEIVMYDLYDNRMLVLINEKERSIKIKYNKKIENTLSAYDPNVITSVFSFKTTEDLEIEIKRDIKLKEERLLNMENIYNVLKDKVDQSDLLPVTQFLYLYKKQENLSLKHIFNKFISNRINYSYTEIRTDETIRIIPDINKSKETYLITHKLSNEDFDLLSRYDSEQSKTNTFSVPKENIGDGLEETFNYFVDEVGANPSLLVFDVEEIIDLNKKREIEKEIIKILLKKNEETRGEVIFEFETDTGEIDSYVYRWNYKNEVLRYFSMLVASQESGYGMQNVRNYLKHFNQPKLNVTFLKRGNTSQARKINPGSIESDTSISAHINVDDLNFRSTPEISNNIIGRLKLNEKVIFIDSLSIKINNVTRGILNKKINLEYNRKKYTFNKYKALSILDTDGDNKLAVSIPLGNGETLDTSILLGDVDLINKEVWAKIEQGGKTGYVYLKFLDFKTNPDGIQTPPLAPQVIEVIDEGESRFIKVEDFNKASEKFQDDSLDLDEEIEEAGEIIDDVPFAVIENVPIYPGCESAGNNAAKEKCMYRKIQEIIKTKFNSVLLSDLGLEGIQQIYVQFKIDKTGNITNVRAKAPHPKLKQEAVKTIKALPKMTPGKQRGQAVGVLSPPIRFQIEN